MAIIIAVHIREETTHRAHHEGKTKGIGQKAATTLVHGGHRLS